MSLNWWPRLVKRNTRKSLARQPSTFPLNSATVDNIDPSARTTGKNTQGDPIADKTLDVLSGTLNKSSEQLERRESAAYGNIDGEGDLIYESIGGVVPAQAKNGKGGRTASDQAKMVAPRPKKASNASEGTPIDQSFLSSEGILKVGCYDKPLPSAHHDLCYEELPCNSGPPKSEGDNDYLPVVNESLNNGHLIIDSEASASNCALLDKTEVRLKNRKPADESSQAVPSDDDEVYETVVENPKRDSTCKETVSQRPSYIYGNDVEV